MIGVTPARAGGALVAHLSQNSGTDEVRQEEARESSAGRSPGQTGERSRTGARPLGPPRDLGESRPMEYHPPCQKWCEDGRKRENRARMRRVNGKSTPRGGKKAGKAEVWKRHGNQEKIEGNKPRVVENRKRDTEKKFQLVQNVRNAKVYANRTTKRGRKHKKMGERRKKNTLERERKKFRPRKSGKYRARGPRPKDQTAPVQACLAGRPNIWPVDFSDGR
ncbi:hypothetical protein CsSME_00031799 [Camellia sinensis var. sinensis]